MTDREIVIALAEKVMGFVCSSRMELGHYLPCDRSDVDAIAVWLPDPEQPNLMSVQHWSPLESISDAWMIVEKLQALDKYVRIEIRPSGNSTVDVWRWGNVITMRGESIPRLICLAALTAVGVSDSAEKGKA